MKRSGRLGKVKVTPDGEGVVSHAGAELLREMAGFTGLIDAWDRALIGTYKAMPIHFPGTVLAELAVAIADGADSISDLKALRDQPVLFGPVASASTAWRVLDRARPFHSRGCRAVTCGVGSRLAWPTAVMLRVVGARCVVRRAERRPDRCWGRKSVRRGA